MRLSTVALLALMVAAPEPTPQEIRARLSTYLAEYEPKLSELIADERVVQHDVPMHEGRPGSESIRRRTLLSEVAFIALPGNAGWLGFRRVLKVDDAPVFDTLGALTATLASGQKEDYARARIMLNESARFNLGKPRTINLPNLPLELLQGQHAGRFSIRIAGSERIGGHRTTKLVLVENVSPTIVRELDGSDMRSIISAFVEPETGRLWRADVIIRDPRPTVVQFDHIVSVTFEENRALGLVVPSRMREDFFSAEDRKAWGEATYANYRRFQTSARIVPQGEGY